MSTTFLCCTALVFALTVSANGELVVAEGLAVAPFAIQEQLSNPASIDVDDRGRVWVGEAVNYRKKARKEGDRILILEDSNADGRADKTKVFYQDPDIDGVHGVCVLGNKVVVSAPDRILLLTDVDGDDKADEKKLLFMGKVLNPVHGQHDHAIHAVMFGPDGRLYFNFGNYNAGLWRADGTLVKDVFGNPVDNSRKPYQEGMVIRCEMDGSQVEVLGYNFRNNWEVTVDSFGSMWQSDNDNGASSCRVNFVMEYGNYGYREEMTGRGYQSKRTNMEATMQRQMWHQNDPGVVPNLLITGRGAPTGILVYEGNLLPKPFRGQMIHAEPGRNVVWAFPTRQVGAGYQASITNLVHSRGDPNYRPSDVSVAPDGSLIIADWFDPVDCCHRTINDAGRIFRVAPPGHAYAVPDFDFQTPTGATKALRSPNLSVRYKAWTALQTMQEKARPALGKMATDNNPRFRARALWALAAIKDGAQKAIELALKDADDNLRALALRIARRHGMPIEPLVRRLVRDESTLVRRECAVSLHRVATPEAAGLWAELALQHDGKDRWYLEALGIGEKGNETACLNAWLKKIGAAWNAPAGCDIIWRSRAPEAPGMLAKLVLDPKVPESEHPRLMRAFDFHSGKAKEDALATLLLNLDVPAKPQKPNVLFIAIDDMNDWIGPLGGHPQAITPNLDRLAKMGVTFRNAHTASPACHSSRVAIMTGVRPSTSGITANVFQGIGPNWRKNPKLADVVTLSQHFRNNGYTAVGGGKIYHALQWWNGSENDPDTWDSYFPEPHKPIPFQVRPPTRDVQAHEASCFGRRPLGNHLFGWLPVAEADPGMSDYKVVDWAVSEMKKKRDKPFFIAAGIFRPHIPWEVPAKYFDMYPLDKVQLPAHKKDDLIDTWDHGRRSWHQWVAQNDQWKQAVRGYLASITFADAMVGRLLDGLQRSGREKNTIIVLWSDHGMHIGEKENWEKFTCWEESTRIPMFVVAPGVTGAGGVCDRSVSTLDIYPTLAELAGTALPKQLEGESLLPLLNDPKSGKRIQPAISSYRRIHGVRTDHWRYVFDPGSKLEELYDHRKDQGEHDNLAYLPEHQAELDLHRSLLRRYTPVATPEGKATPPKSFERLPNNRIRRKNYFPMARAVTEAKAADGRGEPAPILGRKTAAASSKKSGVKKLALIDPAREGKVRSGGNGLEIQLTFRNRSKTDILVYWIDTSGERVRYKEIKPGGQVEQRTYSGHYWLVVDHTDKALGMYKAENQDGLIHIQ